MKPQNPEKWPKTTTSGSIYERWGISKNGGIKNKGIDPKKGQKCDQNHRKNDRNPENRAKATVYIYICCLTRFSGVISSFSGRKMEDHSWQETTDYDQF